MCELLEIIEKASDLSLLKEQHARLIKGLIIRGSLYLHYTQIVKIKIGKPCVSLPFADKNIFINLLNFT